MKIILITSSLEPGRDGVGDYARRLGEELILLGNEVALLSLNDKFTDTTLSGHQLAGDLEIPVLRIPASINQTQKISQAKGWIANFNPDWLSLQYVPFGYHPKGLPFGLSKMLRTISHGRRWQLMFHELWVGMAAEESGKLKLWGKLQRYIIQSLIRNLAPQVIHTQTKLYREHLYKMGYKATYLPIFSNIPVKSDYIKVTTNNIRLVVFGLIHTGAAIEALAADAAAYSSKYKVPVILVFVGHCGIQQNAWSTIWKQTGLEVEILGEQPEEEISAILQNATIGLSSTAIAVVEKSGAFAAMRTHQLPVLNISKPWTPVGVPQQQVPPGITAYTEGGFEAFLIEREKHIAPGNEPAAIAKKMLDDLLTNM